MIRLGSTITLEAWGNRFKNNLDWNHAWGAVPANTIPRGLWGIQPKSPGFTIATIKPQLSSLKESTIKVPTVLGEIVAEYKRISSARQVYKIELPANMLGEFEVKTGHDDVVTVNGKKVIPGFGTIRLNPGVSVIELKVNSF